MQKDKKQRAAEFTDTTTSQPLQKTKRNKIASLISMFLPDGKLVSGLFLFTLLAGLVFVALNYKPRPSTARKSLQVAGVSISNETGAQADKTLEDLAAAQKINIAINGNTYSYTAKDLGVKRDFSSVIDANYSPPKSLLNKLTAKNTAPGMQTYIQKKQLISALEAKLGQYKTTVNASVSVSGGNISVNPSKTGIGLDFDQIAEQLERTDLRDNQTILVKFTQSNPDIPTAAAEAARTQAEMLIQPMYGVSTAGSAARYASAAQKAGWLVFTPDEAKHTISVSINTKAAQSTMAKLAQSYSQPAKDKITLTATDGSTSVIDNGQEGINVDQTSLDNGLNQFQSALNDHQAYTFPVTLAVQAQGERDLGTSTGGKFVLVDVADYRAYAIDNTTVDRTMVVSTGRPGMETPKGHFTILSKTRLVTMSGCNVKVGCWTVPNVPNAEFFTKDGDALHGTYWYVNWGHQNLSHGCVNLQLGDAAWLYDWTQVGTDVIVA
jgi:lipoprotein-anchoring transpeptidase ErfK/SrfK